MHKKVFLLPALLAILITFAWAEVPANLSFFGDKYIQTGAPERNFSGTFYTFSPANKIGKKITVFAYTANIPKSTAQVSADDDLSACQKRSKNNNKINCEQIKCGENDYLVSEFMRVNEYPTKIQLSRYTPEGSIKFTDSIIATKPSGTMEEYRDAFCKLKAF